MSGHRPVDLEERGKLVPESAQVLVGHAVVHGHGHRGRDLLEQRRRDRGPGVGPLRHQAECSHAAPFGQKGDDGHRVHALLAQLLIADRETFPNVLRPPHDDRAAVLHDPPRNRPGARDGLALEELCARLPVGRVDGQRRRVTGRQEEDHAADREDALERLRHRREERLAVEATGHRAMNLQERRQLIAGEPQVTRRALQPELEIPARLL